MSDLTISDVVDAYFDAEKYQEWPEEMSGYYNSKLGILVTLFECGLPIRDSGSGRSDEDRDRHALVSTAYNCLQRAKNPLNPFGWYLEGVPGPLEARVLAKHRQKFDAEERALQDRYRAIFRSVLDLLHPEASSRSFPRTVLVDHGLPRNEPDEMDFW